MWRNKHTTAALMALVWVIIGFMAFGLETMVLHAHKVQHNEWANFLTYLFPPLLFGYPMALGDQIIFDRSKRQYSFGKMLLGKIFYYLAGIIMVFLLIKLTLEYFDQSLNHFHFIKFLIIWGVAASLNVVLKNIYDHFDRNIFKSWVRGRYYVPAEEERIFLFLDINGSTTIAERLGSKHYFNFLNDFHQLVEKAVVRFNGELYQYVGDEAIITWDLDNGLAHNNAIETFFHIEHTMAKNAAYFHKTYGVIPKIKGSLHYGPVTKGELGNIKKDFAYTGDVLNTTARMYSLCKNKNESLVVSRRLLNHFNDISKYNITPHGYFVPRGKQEKIFVFSLGKCKHQKAEIDHV